MATKGTMRWMVLMMVLSGASIGLCGGWLVLGDARLVDLRPVEFRSAHPLEHTGGPQVSAASKVHGAKLWRQRRKKSIAFDMTVESHPVRTFLPIRGPASLTMRVDGKETSFSFAGTSGDTMTLTELDGEVVLNGDAQNTPAGSAWTYHVLQRILTLPFTLEDFEIQERLGPAIVGDKTYERVYLSAAPLTDVSLDQYRVAFEPKTNRVAWVEMTDRRLGKAIEYRVEYQYSRVVEAIQTPEKIILHEMAFTGAPLLTLDVGSVAP